jgi:hypothetical protein
VRRRGPPPPPPDDGHRVPRHPASRPADPPHRAGTRGSGTARSPRFHATPDADRYRGEWEDPPCTRGPGSEKFPCGGLPERGRRLLGRAGRGCGPGAPCPADRSRTRCTGGDSGERSRRSSPVHRRRFATPRSGQLRASGGCLRPDGPGLPRRPSEPDDPGHEPRGVGRNRGAGLARTRSRGAGPG